MISCTIVSTLIRSLSPKFTPLIRPAVRCHGDSKILLNCLSPEMSPFLWVMRPFFHWRKGSLIRGDYCIYLINYNVKNWKNYQELKYRLSYFIGIKCLFFRVYLCKQWQELCVFNDHTAMATGVRFGHNSTFVSSVSMDRSVKFFGTS